MDGERATASVARGPGSAFGATPEIDSIRAFVAERFDEAAVGLKESVRAEAKQAEEAGKKPTVSAEPAYFLGRAFQELGLRGLALHYLAQAELYGSPAWRLLARRGLAPASEEVPTEAPAETGSPAETEGETTPQAKHAGKPEKEKPAKVTGEGPSGKSDVTLPNVGIQGELERPDIFFVMPRAQDASGEELMRARIRREITRPVIKDCVEEEMLLK